MEVGVRDLKAKLSEYLRRVENGEEFQVTDHGVPVARLSPLSFYPLPENTASALGEPPPPDYVVESPSRRKSSSGKKPLEEESYASLLRYAQKKGKHATQKAALIAILKEHVRIQRQLELLDLAGTIDYYPDYDPKKGRRKR